MPKTVDPAVFELASQFVGEVLRELEGDEIRRISVDPDRRRRLIQQAADAMQQAVEDEVQAIREQLEG